MGKKVKAKQACTLNTLMHIINADINGNQFSAVPLAPGDVSVYNWMPRDRYQYMKWKAQNSSKVSQLMCSQPYAAGITQVHYPNGWIRFGLPQPTKAVHGVLYHGTGPAAVLPILTSALLPGQAQEGSESGKKAVFLTPSLVYAASPRYATENETSGFSSIFQCADCFIQCVLEVSTFCAPDKRQAETLGDGANWEGGGWATRPWGNSQSGGQGRPYPNDHKVIDPNFGNNYDLEWLFYVTDEASSKAKMQVTAVLFRVTDDGPGEAYQRRKRDTPVTRH